MKRLAILVAILAVAGCQKKHDLRPFIAVAGYYSMTAAGPTPAPLPPAPSAECTKGCKCGGTGREKTGDGLSTTPCRCPDNCQCKASKASTCTTGSCGWPPRNINR